MDYLYHYGVKGMHWGVRRYQYADGTLTPAGRKHYKVSDDSFRRGGQKTKEAINAARTVITGKQYVDGYLKTNTDLKRIQTSSDFEPYPFYATYKKADNEKYMGLFGKNLKSRASNEARRAEKLAEETQADTDILNAKLLRDKSDSLKVYQLSIKNTKKLKIPSDTNAADITASLLRDEKFKSNLEVSLSDSKSKMKRPSQQILFKQAQNALKRDISDLTSQDKIAIYRAFNLSLVNHNAEEIAAQNQFYAAMRKKGYNALLDYNDKEYSSYKAKRPMIVFDMDSVKLDSVVETNPDVVDRLNRKYRRERILKEIPYETVGLIKLQSSKTIDECYSYLNSRLNDYLS